MYSVDKYEPNIGDWVHVAKVDCPHDKDDEWPYTLSDTTVCKTPSVYKIIKHETAGLGCA